MSSCIEAHPGYSVRIWRDPAKLGTLVNQAVYDAAEDIAPLAPRGNPWQIRSNVLRFEIMLRFGGIFLDSDITALRSMEPLVQRVESEDLDGMLGWEIQDRWLGEAVIAAVPGAPFLERIVSGLESWAMGRKRKPATVTVGPQYITPRLRGTPELDRVLVMPQAAFFPARHNQPELGDRIVAEGADAHPDVYGVHGFFNFRRKQALGIA